MAWMDVLEPVGSAGFILALLPQFYRTLRVGQARDVDVGFLVIVLASSVVLLVWAAARGAGFLATSFAANLVVWGTVLFYRLRPRRVAAGITRP